ncbi:MAG: YqgE/AlgH family protein [Neomegalonema sp.]|nr:YqgE/AlgH family protein [Neomegalonema sp.]
MNKTPHSGSTSSSSGESLAGRMIVAMPKIGDPRFEKTVIYLFAHEADGAMGLIVNRPAEEVSFSDLLEQLSLDAHEDSDDTIVHVGGPVETERGFVLHSSDYFVDNATMRLNDEISMTSTVDILRDMAEGTGPEHALFALGYAGWGPGQLEREIVDNAWLHCEADNELVFSVGEDQKWTQALAKIGIDPSVLSSRAGNA